MSFNIDYNSVKQICGETTQVMVYGRDHCRYEDLLNKLKHEGEEQGIKQVFDCWLGNWKPKEKEYKITTVEGRKIEQIQYESEMGNKHCARMCKAAIVNIILENWKRKQENLPLIPFIFCIDIDHNPYSHLLQNSCIASRDQEYNKLITNKELRRCYKLCYPEDKELAPISEIARKTFKFVKLVTVETYQYEEYNCVWATTTFEEGKKYKLEEIAPFWEGKDWDFLWKTRQQTTALKDPKNPKKTSWREQLKKGYKM